MADDCISIRWAGGERRLDPGVVRLGRDPANDIVVDNPHVSRQHGELRHGADGWTYTDLGSAQGTFVDTRRVTTLPVRGAVALQLGRSGGERVDVLVASPPPTPVDSVPAHGPESGGTAMVGEHGNRPGGALRVDQVRGTTVVTGQIINVECAGRSYTFSPGRAVSIGRAGDCDVVSNNPTVSRHHADLVFRDGSWVLRDNASSGGTYVDGQRVDNVGLRGTTAVWLGEVDAGERVVLVTSGTRPRTTVAAAHPTGPPRTTVAAADPTGPRRKTPFVVLGLIAAAAIAVAVVALVRSAGGSSAPSNDRLAKAVVRIDLDGAPAGSGTVIDAQRGLILTNAHVAAPHADGQGVRNDQPETALNETPRTITIAVAPGLDRVAEPKYTAAVAAADGYLDLAVLRITGTVGGAVAEKEDFKGLTAVELGDSDALRTGSPVRVFGFPAISASNASTLTEGVVSGPVEDRRLNSNRAFLNLDAPIRGGNSGGLAADDHGRLVGVPTLVRIRGEETPVSSMRPIKFAADLVAAARDGKTYTSKYVTPLTGHEQLTDFAVVAPARSGFEPTCAGGLVSPAVGGTELALSFRYDGFTAAQPQDVRVELTRPDGRLVGSAVTNDQFPFPWDDKGCATVTLGLVEPLVSGRYVASIYVGPNYQLMARVEVPVP